ncbi:MAG TPA: hypothetical protein VKH62_12100, partial [Candidatus Binatia bacterium]|nr:hypothetical protein [Candidatus Binatia bacterium]
GNCHCVLCSSSMSGSGLSTLTEKWDAPSSGIAELAVVQLNSPANPNVGKKFVTWQGMTIKLAICHLKMN